MKVVLFCIVALQARALLLFRNSEPDTMMPQSIRIRAAEHRTFNVAFNGSIQEGGLMIGRFLQGKIHRRACNYTRPGWMSYNDAFAVARWSPSHGELHFSPVKIPEHVVCSNVGEPKWVQLNGHMYVYSYGHGRCPAEMYHNLPAGFKNTYNNSRYKSYLMKFDPGTATLSGAVVLATEEPVDPRNPTMKNFAFFTHKNDTLAITLACPHRVHKVDLYTGLMVPAYDSDCDLPYEYEMGLGANPLDLQDGTFLVAGHIREQKWGGLRQTFFYTIEAKPPFKVVAHTPAFNFGFDDHLEYITGLQLIGEHLVISLGIHDCDSVVMDIPLSKVLSRMVRAPKLSSIRFTPKLSPDYRLRGDSDDSMFQPS